MTTFNQRIVSDEGYSVQDAFGAASSCAIKVSWLPSLQLTKKHTAPSIAGIGILYSEDLDVVLQVFKTDNLCDSLKGFSRDQAAALNIDPACRVHWLEIASGHRRNDIAAALVSKMNQAKSGFVPRLIAAECSR